ncbi:MAG: hypothetical protein KF882_09645, partial [Bacteroidia bacterium]|nr:hypothetical protein [Bacteroidia bacterium]
EIAQLEIEKTKLADSLNDSSLSHEQLTQISAKLTSIIQMIDNKEMRWLELSE